MADQITKEFWKNSHFENMIAVFSKFFGDPINQMINWNVGTKNKNKNKFLLDKNRIEDCDLFSLPVFIRIQLGRKIRLQLNISPVIWNSMTVFGLYPGLWQQPIFLWHLQWLEAAVKQKEVKSFSFAFFLSSANGEWCAHLFSWPSTTLVGVTLYINGCQAFLAPKTKAVA